MAQSNTELSRVRYRAAICVAIAIASGCGGTAPAGEEAASLSEAICTGLTLSSSVPGPLPTGSASLLTAGGVSCASGETPEYRFLYRRDGDPTPFTEFRGWSTNPAATFDNTGRPSGKYTIQARTRNVGNASAQTSAVNLVLLSGNVCTNVTLQGSPASPRLPGSTIALTAAATCTEGAAEYQFFVRSPGATTFTTLGGWGGSNFNWNTTGSALGSYTLRVFARGAGNSSAFEAQGMLSYSLADSCNVLAETFAPNSPAVAGTNVTVNGVATCTGGSLPELHLDYRLRGAVAWTLLQDWSNAPSTVWNTSGLAAGIYQVRVQSRAPGLKSAQAARTANYTLTAPRCGDGVIEIGETCDPVASCPATCDDGNACTSDQLTGSATTCNAACSHTPITSCVPADGCCPSGCDAATDSDCAPLVATSLSVGSLSRCAVLTDHSVRCWGFNNFGQLGNGTNAFSSVPVRVSGIANAIAVSIYYQHACALLSDGTVACWGEENHGQLGDGVGADSFVPVHVVGIDNATEISVGAYHSCALLNDATVRCWGFNFWGQLGNGSLSDANLPVSVPGLGNVVSIAAGGQHTCALLADGTIRCWGDNLYGELGSTPGAAECGTQCIPSPASVPGVTNATQLATGETNTCVLRADHTIQCLGSNGNGQLGGGSLGGASAIPVTVTGISTATAVSAGGCALLSGGSAKCWGYNANGQLGNGSTSDSGSPVNVSGINTAIAVGSGGCALLAAGSVRCWGWGLAGALGNGTTSDSLIPVSVSGF